MKLRLSSHSSVGGVTVSMVAFQAVDPGSTPGRRTLFFLAIVLLVPLYTAPSSGVRRAEDTRLWQTLIK